MTLLQVLKQGAERRAVLGRSTLERHWSPVQARAIDLPYDVTVLWGSNAAGKTLALAEICRRYLGREYPWQAAELTPPQLLIASRTWAQVSQLAEYLWAAVDRRWFAERVHFSGGQLAGQRLPVFDLVAGPGVGGKLRLGIFDSANLAGPRAGLVVADEPVPEPVFTELVTRTWGRADRTRMVIGYTPTRGTHHTLTYLWERVDDPSIPDVWEVQAPLSVETCTAPGALLPVPWMSGKRIRREEALVSAVERDMRMGRSRSPPEGAPYYERWAPATMVAARDVHLLRAAGWRLCVGVDHGSKPGAQCAYLVAVLPLEPGRCRVHVVAEYVATTTTSEEDGAGIVRMLSAVGLRVADVDYWVGDRAHESREKAVYKANERLKLGIARAIGIDTRARNWSGALPKPLRYMRTPKKYARSHHERAAVLHGLMVEALLTVDPRCPGLIEAIGTWTGGSREPQKDKLDAMGYPVTEGPWMGPERGARAA